MIGTPMGTRPVLGYCRDCDREFQAIVPHDATLPVQVRCKECETPRNARAPEQHRAKYA